MPVLLYGLDSCTTNVTELRSLEHTVTMAIMKIFNTNSMDIVSYCQSALGFHSVREQVLRRNINFLAKLNQCQNSLCSSLSANRAASEAIIAAHTAQCFSATLTLIVIVSLRPMSILNQAYSYLKS